MKVLNKWYLKNKQLVKNKAKKWALENPEKRKKIWIKNNNKLSTKIRKHEWYLKHKQIILNKSKEWAKNNHNRRKKIALKWANNKYLEYKKDIKFVLNNRIHAIVYHDLKQNKAGKSWKTILSFTLEELKNHLEKQFTNNMNWEKLLNSEIHIDHIKPRHLFHFTNYKDKEFKECWNLSNLQPLWVKDNLSKGGKYNENK
jgi:hypothetical protein